MSRLHIHLHGQDNRCATYMTDAQKEQAEAPFAQEVTHWDRAGYAIGGLAVFFSFLWWLS